MESKSEIEKRVEFDDRYFKISYSLIFATIIALNAIFIPSLLLGWLGIIYIFQAAVGIIRFLYVLIIISPIIKIVFAGVEIGRYVSFQKSDKKDIEGANNIARGFIGTRIVRVYTLVIIIIIVVISEIFQFVGRVVGFPRDAEFFFFYTWFPALVIMDIYLTAVGPHLIKYSIDYTNKKKRFKVLDYSIVWIVVIVFIFLLDYLIPYFFM